MQKAFIFSLLILFFLSCNQNSEIKQAEKKIPDLVKIGYFPSFHQPAETIINLKEKYLLFYSPTSYNPLPPPPPANKNSKEEITRLKKNYEEYLAENPELIPFKTKISQKEIDEITAIINSFDKKDFNNKNLIPALDGLSTNIVISYSDGKIVQMNPMNVPNNKQYKLYSKVLEFVKTKNTNQHNSIILERIQIYN